MLLTYTVLNTNAPRTTSWANRSYTSSAISTRDFITTSFSTAITEAVNSSESYISSFTQSSNGEAGTTIEYTRSSTASASNSASATTVIGAPISTVTLSGSTSFSTSLESYYTEISQRNSSSSTRSSSTESTSGSTSESYREFDFLSSYFSDGDFNSLSSTTESGRTETQTTFETEITSDFNLTSTIPLVSWTTTTTTGSGITTSLLSRNATDYADNDDTYEPPQEVIRSIVFDSTATAYNYTFNEDGDRFLVGTTTFSSPSSFLWTSSVFPASVTTQTSTSSIEKTTAITTSTVNPETVGAGYSQDTVYVSPDGLFAIYTLDASSIHGVEIVPDSNVLVTFEATQSRSYSPITLTRTTTFNNPVTTSSRTVQTITFSSTAGSRIATVWTRTVFPNISTTLSSARNTSSWDTSSSSINSSSANFTVPTVTQVSTRRRQDITNQLIGIYPDGITTYSLLATGIRSTETFIGTTTRLGFYSTTGIGTSSGSSASRTSQAESFDNGAFAASINKHAFLRVGFLDLLNYAGGAILNSEGILGFVGAVAPRTIMNTITSHQALVGDIGTTFSGNLPVVTARSVGVNSVLALNPLPTRSFRIGTTRTFFVSITPLSMEWERRDRATTTLTSVTQTTTTASFTVWKETSSTTSLTSGTETYTATSFTVGTETSATISLTSGTETYTATSFTSTSSGGAISEAGTNSARFNSGFRTLDLRLQLPFGNSTWAMANVLPNEILVQQQPGNYEIILNNNSASSTSRVVEFVSDISTRTLSESRAGFMYNGGVLGVNSNSFSINFFDTYRRYDTRS